MALSSVPTHTFHEDFSMKFFHPLLVSDPTLRRNALEHTIEFLLKPENERLLKAHMATLVRVAEETPFQDIVGAFRGLLRVVEVV